MKKNCLRLNQRTASLSIAMILAFGNLTPTVAHPVPSPAEMYLDCETRAADDRERNQRITTQRYRRSQHQYNARMRGAWRIYDDALETASEILAAEIIAIQTAYLFCTAAPVVCHSVMGVAMIAVAGQYRLAVSSATYALNVRADEAQRILNADLDLYDDAEAQEEDRISKALARCTLGVQNHVRTAH